MSENEKNDLFYFCSLFEYIARKTKNYRKDLIEYFSDEIISWQLKVASVNHSLSYEQVSDELISKLNIKNGTYDCVKECHFEVPDFLAIGRVFQVLISDVSNGDLIQSIKSVYSSFISDEICYFNSNIYYSSPEYLHCCYSKGKLIA